MIKSILISAIVVYLLASFVHWDITPFQELKVEVRGFYAILYFFITYITYAFIRLTR